MDKVGVDAAIYISPFSMYQYDGSYAVSVTHTTAPHYLHRSRSIEGQGVAKVQQA
jgi:hypothetical protein